MHFQESVHLRSVYNIEALVWSLVLGVYLLRFMTLGTKINRKYRNLSVLITEQVSLSDHRLRFKQVLCVQTVLRFSKNLSVPKSIQKEL